MTLFVERRAVVQAVQFTGDNIRAVADMVHPGWQSGEMPPGWWTMTRPGESRLVIEEAGCVAVTLKPGDWLIRRGRWSLHVLDNDEFAEMFQAARDIGVQP